MIADILFVQVDGSEWMFGMARMPLPGAMVGKSLKDSPWINYIYLKLKMKFLSLQPFVPSGKDFDGSKRFFQELGFEVGWDAGDYVGFKLGTCQFILQRYDHKEFAENFMVNVAVDDVDAFYNEVQGKGLPEKYGIRINKPVNMPYGREVNLIDLAGVCWHFVQG